MKRRALILLAALIALPVIADEPAPVQDSPLVAAAKRSKATKKQAIVITNETLKQSGTDAHITTTKKQAALPKMQAAAPVEAPKPAADKPKVKPQRKAQPHDDAEQLEDDPGTRGDMVPCSTCLPILEPVNASLPITKAELSNNPPRVATPELAQVVPPRTAETPPPF